MDIQISQNYNEKKKISIGDIVITENDEGDTYYLVVGLTNPHGFVASAHLLNLAHCEIDTIKTMRIDALEDEIDSAMVEWRESIKSIIPGNRIIISSKNDTSLKEKIFPSGEQLFEMASELNNLYYTN